MPVAKTYEKMVIQGEPFKENGRMYVNVAAPKGQKKVRWYTDAEYRRMYPDTVVEHNTMDFNAKHAFGFEETNYITLYKGKDVEGWANEDRTHIYYNCTFGFYTPGRFQLPHLNKGIEPVQLQWEQIVDHDTRMKPHEEVKKIVDQLLKIESISTYQGEIDAWLQKTVMVKEKKTRDSHFGTKHTYTLADADGNIYIWETGAKDYESGKTISLKMKVKEHKEIGGEKVTVIWYCKEI